MRAFNGCFAGIFTYSNEDIRQTLALLLHKLLKATTKSILI